MFTDWLFKVWTCPSSIITEFGWTNIQSLGWLIPWNVHGLMLFATLEREKRYLDSVNI